MGKLSESNQADATIELMRRRDAAIESAVVEGYRLLTIARWSGQEIPVDLLVDRQIDEIASLVGGDAEAAQQHARMVASAKFAELEKSYEHVA